MAFESRSLDDYIDVAQRIAEFRDKYPNGSLQPLNLTDPWRPVTVSGTDKSGEVVTQVFIVYTAAAYRDALDPRPGVGMAWEVFPGRTPYTRGSELMNAETSAWGRAIIAALAGDAKKGVASREEVRNRQAERDDGLPVNADGSLSRSRTTDEQKQAAGVMTDAQQREHNRLAKPPPVENPVERLGTTPDDDPFYLDQPVDDSDYDTPGTITPNQSKAIHATFAELGIRNRDQRLIETEKIAGRLVESTNDLSYGEARRLLTELNRRRRSATNKR